MSVDPRDLVPEAPRTRGVAEALMRLASPPERPVSYTELRKTLEVGCETIADLLMVLEETGLPYVELRLRSNNARVQMAEVFRRLR